MSSLLLSETSERSTIRFDLWSLKYWLIHSFSVLTLNATTWSRGIVSRCKRFRPNLPDRTWNRGRPSPYRIPTVILLPDTPRKRWRDSAPKWPISVENSLILRAESVIDLFFPPTVSHLECPSREADPGVELPIGRRSEVRNLTYRTLSYRNLLDRTRLPSTTEMLRSERCERNARLLWSSCRCSLIQSR